MKTTTATCRHRHGYSASPLIVFFLFLSLLCSAAAQTTSNPGSPPEPFPNAWRGNFNPAMAVIVIGLISAFFFMAFFSIYLRNRRERDSRALTAGGNGGARSRRVGGAPRGLEAAVIQTFPTLVYSEVKEHKIGKGALECAVCLSEFEDDDTLRLLPKCDHVFHPDCIDLWLASHTTCPVCRTNLSPAAAAAGDPSPPAGDDAVLVPVEPPEQVAITIDEEEEGVTGAAARRAEEVLPKPLPASRAARRRSWSFSRVPRSHSTGHSLQPAVEEDRERYTLRLPENIRREVVAGKFRRSASCLAASASGGEGSYRKARVGGSVGGRSFKMKKWEWSVKSDRWASFKRTFSVKISRGDDASESSPRKGGDGGVPSAAAAAMAAGRLSFKMRVNPSTADSVDSRGGSGAATDVRPAAS
ncbi:unnamed protein product [Spirodela intermedia]|uniref:RING-type E3 ubiquitin transferase n=1 Tax=Spirodela intermedia TaxID=51605 RepID=A0A7I8KBI5_SPIIN|nr:unnamed protein product [Spirodela intermedia]